MTVQNAIQPKSVTTPPPAPACALCRSISGHTKSCLTRIPDPADWPRTVAAEQNERNSRPWNGPAPARPALVDKQWYKIQNVGPNAADMWIYDEIGGWGITAQNLVAELSTLNVAQITVHVNSPGGDVFDGIAIMNSLRDHPANVTVVVDALAASIASVIAQAGNKIIMGRNSTMMIHNASGFAMGEGKDLRKMADLLDGTTANIASIYAERAGGTPKQWLAVMNEETWYSAEEAVAAGLADEVAPLATEREAHAMAAKWDLSNYAHAPAALTHDELTVVGLQPIDEPVSLAELDAETTEPIAWDPAGIKAALTAALPVPEPEVTWDPGLFASAISLVTNDVPAPAAVTPTPEPTAAPGFDVSTFADAIRKARAIS